MRKFLILVLFLYILALLQTSFLIHFNIDGQVPNLILISILLLIFLEKPEEKFSFFGALAGGLLLDVFSSSFLGISIIVLLLMTFVLKKVCRILKELNVSWFLILLFFSLIFYNLFSSLIGHLVLFDITSFQINLSKVLAFEFFYNLVLGAIAFCFRFIFQRYVFIK